MKRIFFALAIVCALSVNSDAGFSGNDMLPACAMLDRINTTGHGESAGDDMVTKIAICAATIEAVMMTFQASFGMNPQAANVCVPIDAVDEQGVSIVVRYLIDNPQIRNVDFNISAITAISQAWPCKGKPIN